MTGENGRLVTADDPGAHAAALLALLADPAAAARLGATGRRLVETQWHWGVMEGRLLALYASVLDNNSDPRGS